MDRRFTPAISVVVACYNHAVYLSEALNSIYIQSFNNWECLIVDDGSTDNTKEVAEKWLKIDNRFRYIYQNNKGVSSARNLGISKARGKYILPLDADDKIGQTYIEEAISVLENNDDVLVVYSKAKMFGLVNSNWNLPIFSLQKLSERNIIFCSGIYRKESWIEIGGYDENMDIALEDWEFWISLLKNGGEVYRINKVCFYYRIKEKSRNTDVNPENYPNLYKYLENKHFDFFLNYLGSIHYFNFKLEKEKNNKTSFLSIKKIKKLLLKIGVK